MGAMEKSSSKLLRFIALWDIHWGFERRNRKKIPIHDPRTLASVLSFARDFKPDVVVWGGDLLDCSAISHHNRKKRLAVEDLRLAEDAAGLAHFMGQLRAAGSVEQEYYLLGNHEDWLRDVVEEYPALEGILSVRNLLQLPESVAMVDQGGSLQLGKLVFLHGDQLKGGDYVAKRNGEIYAKNIRFGHYHTYQVATRCSPLDQDDIHTAIAVPCLCRRDLSYGEGAPNKWAQGFLWGYLGPKSFTDQVTVVTKRGFTALGKDYPR